MDSASSGWPTGASNSNSSSISVEDDLDAMDLQHEIERERWQATDAAVAAQWNSTANTTLSHQLQPTSSSTLQFTPLSSMRSEFLSDSSSNGHEGIFMPPSSSVLRGDSLGPALGSTASYQLQASSFAAAGGGGNGAGSVNQMHSYSTHGFPSASGLSRDAPTFNPSMSAAAALLVEDSGVAAVAPISAAPSLGHTRLPLPASNSLAAVPSPAVTGGLFNSFNLPSFSSFSSFGTSAVSNSSGSSLSSDWSSAIPHLVDDSDALFTAHGLNAHDGDDVTLIPGSRGNQTLGSSWLSKQQHTDSPFGTTPIQQLNRNSMPVQHALNFQSLTD